MDVMGRRKKRKRRGDKRKALRAHSFRRAVERYDLDLTDELRKEIIGKINRNGSKPVETQSNRVTVHDVKLNTGETVRVAYDKKRRQLITFLYMDPEDYLSSHTIKRTPLLTAGPSNNPCPACEHEKAISE